MTGALHRFAASVPPWLASLRVPGTTAGQYFRHAAPKGSQSAPDVYGSADAATILWSLKRLPADPALRRVWVAHLRSFQDPTTGAFTDPTHSQHHTTAQVVGALELFDAAPSHPLVFLDGFRDAAALSGLLDGLNWSEPWPTSHIAAGAASALMVVDGVGARAGGRAGVGVQVGDRYSDRAGDWAGVGAGAGFGTHDGWRVPTSAVQQAFFGWLDSAADPDTGLWHRDHRGSSAEFPGFFGNLGASFHFHFLYEYTGRALPHPERVIDSCLALLHGAHPVLASETFGVLEGDWIYSAHRALRLTRGEGPSSGGGAAPGYRVGSAPGYREGELAEAFGWLAERASAILTPAYCADVDDVHAILGTVNALAELGLAATTVGLPEASGLPDIAQVLDRRPFI